MLACPWGNRRMWPSLQSDPVPSSDLYKRYSMIHADVDPSLFARPHVIWVRRPGHLRVVDRRKATSPTSWQSWR